MTTIFKRYFYYWKCLINTWCLLYLVLCRPAIILSLEKKINIPYYNQCSKMKKVKMHKLSSTIHPSFLSFFSSSIWGTSFGTSCSTNLYSFLEWWMFRHWRRLYLGSPGSPFLASSPFWLSYPRTGLNM